MRPAARLTWLCGAAACAAQLPRGPDCALCVDELVITEADATCSGDEVLITVETRGWAEATRLVQVWPTATWTELEPEEHELCSDRWTVDPKSEFLSASLGPAVGEPAGNVCCTDGSDHAVAGTTVTTCGPEGLDEEATFAVQIEKVSGSLACVVFGHDGEGIRALLGEDGVDCEVR